MLIIREKLENPLKNHKIHYTPIPSTGASRLRDELCSQLCVIKFFEKIETSNNVEEWEVVEIVEGWEKCQRALVRV